MRISLAQASAFFVSFRVPCAHRELNGDSSCDTCSIQTHPLRRRPNQPRYINVRVRPTPSQIIPNHSGHDRSANCAPKFRNSKRARARHSALGAREAGLRPVPAPDACQQFTLFRTFAGIVVQMPSSSAIFRIIFAPAHKEGARKRTSGAHKHDFGRHGFAKTQKLFAVERLLIIRMVRHGRRTKK